MFTYEDYKKSANFIKERMGNYNPKIAIVLGSGLGSIIEDFEEKVIINYKNIPNYPESTIEGHAGELIIGRLDGVDIIAMNGRFHYYEGYDISQTTFPIRVFKLLGIEKLILTNASGGINTSFEAGDFMIINDYLSFFVPSPLRGKNIDEFGPRFPDTSETFDKELSSKLKSIINKYTGRAQEGVYAFMPGPTYETPAEIRALRIMGADSVGMSTVPEAIIANHCGLKTACVTCITNMASGVSDKKLSHEDVTETAGRVKGLFKEIIKDFIKEIN